jgi:hypothetical protein
LAVDVVGQGLEQGAVGGLATPPLAASLQHAQPIAGGTPRGLLQQARLADARLAGEQQQRCRRLGGRHLRRGCQVARQEGEFVGTADQGQE